MEGRGVSNCWINELCHFSSKTANKSGLADKASGRARVRVVQNGEKGRGRYELLLFLLCRLEERIARKDFSFKGLRRGKVSRLTFSTVSAMYMVHQPPSTQTTTGRGIIVTAAKRNKRDHSDQAGDSHFAARNKMSLGTFCSAFPEKETSGKSTGRDLGC